MIAAGSHDMYLWTLPWLIGSITKPRSLFGILQRYIHFQFDIQLQAYV